jgi:hypothetical protein
MGKKVKVRLLQLFYKFVVGAHSTSVATVFTSGFVATLLLHAAFFTSGIFAAYLQLMLLQIIYT